MLRLDDALDRLAVFHSSPGSSTTSTTRPLTDFYKIEIPDGPDVLDESSSSMSHFPEDWKRVKTLGLGMMADELRLIRSWMSMWSATLLNRE